MITLSGSENAYTAGQAGPRGCWCRDDGMGLIFQRSFLFDHLPKTGGTAFRTLLEEFFGRENVSPHLDGRSERLDRKIRDAKLKKVPYVAVVGGKEVESGHVNVQNRAGEKSDMPLESFVSMISAEIAERRR